MCEVFLEKKSYCASSRVVVSVNTDARISFSLYPYFEKLFIINFVYKLLILLIIVVLYYESKMRTTLKKSDDEE